MGFCWVVGWSDGCGAGVEWLWVVGCGLGIDVDGVDVGWDRRRRRGGAWLGKRPLSSFTLRFSLFSPLSLTPILSLKLGFSFGLIFCYGHRCISRFMVVVVGGCCGGGGDGFIVGLRRWPRIWVAICQSLGRI